MATVAAPVETTPRSAPVIEPIVPPALEPTIEPTIEPTSHEIAARAYEIYRERGGEEGHDLDDWLQAEQELIERRRRQIAES